VTDTTVQDRRQRLIDRLLEGHMSKADRTRWRTARSLADVGELTAAWLHGEIRQTPTHSGPPQDETIPYIDVLAAVNRAGFVTDNSQAAVSDEWGECEAWVSGLVSEETLARVLAALAGTPLVTVGARGRDKLGNGSRGAWRDTIGSTGDRCPRAVREICAAWRITITDPEPGRNDRLWPALSAFAAPGKEI
jgi:hypothetical protein